jgi:hypothetical protein
MMSDSVCSELNEDLSPKRVGEKWTPTIKIWYSLKKSFIGEIKTPNSFS